MYAVSPFWLAAHQAAVLRVVCYAEIWEPPGPSNPSGTKLATFAINKGSLKVDVTNAILRTISGIEMVDADPKSSLVPVDAADILFPDGNELYLWRGCLYPSTNAYANAPTISVPWVNNGAPVAGEVVPMGRFLMEGIDIDDAAGALTITVQTGSDRSETVSRAKFTNPYATAAGATVAAGIQAILTAVTPYLPTLVGANAVTPAVMNWNIGDDPWAAAQALAAAGSEELHFDVTGVPRLAAIVDSAPLPAVASFIEGETCTMHELHRKVNNAQVPNWIVVQSQGSGVATPLRSDWKDTNPESPTYIGGKYPTTVDTVTTTAATTQAECDAIAAAAGNAAIGQIEMDAFVIRGDPALAENDIVAVQRQRAGVDGKYVVNQLDVDLAVGGATTVTGRSIAA